MNADILMVPFAAFVKSHLVHIYQNMLIS